VVDEGRLAEPSMKVPVPVFARGGVGGVVEDELVLPVLLEVVAPVEPEVITVVLELVELATVDEELLLFFFEQPVKASATLARAIPQIRVLRVFMVSSRPRGPCLAGGPLNNSRAKARALAAAKVRKQALGPGHRRKEAERKSEAQSGR